MKTFPVILVLTLSAKLAICQEEGEVFSKATIVTNDGNSMQCYVHLDISYGINVMYRNVSDGPIEYIPTRNVKINKFFKILF